MQCLPTCASPKPHSVINRLILPSDDRRVIVHVELIFAGVSIPRSRLQWSQASSLGKHRTSSSVGRLHAGEKATTTRQSGSIVLDCIEETLEELESGARIRSA